MKQELHESRLAIVIPAYKDNFLAESIESIACQTNRDFKLYIGDDCSPYDLYRIVKKYEDRIDLSYRRFETNLGGRDLVAQWERCINLINDEEWIWLFSDDDTMGPDCVENFYRTLEKNPDYDLFHFNVRKIDGTGNLTSTQFQHFPEVLTSEEFLINKLQPGYYSTAVEYIFRKSHFFNKGGFEKFDLAWCSDDATWIKLGKRRGIRTINNSIVCWRESEFNISSVIVDREIFRRKLSAQQDFACWLYRHAVDKRLNINFHVLRGHLRTWYFRSMKYGIKSLRFRHIPLMLLEFDRALDGRQPHGTGSSFLIFYKIYRSLADSFKETISGLSEKDAPKQISSI